MSWVAAGVASAALTAKIVGRYTAKRKAKKERKKAQAEIAARTEQQKKDVARGYADRQQAERDLGNVYEGMTSIDPEAAQARDDNERATASAIEKATRTGASGGEIMNMVSGLTGHGQKRARGISGEQNRRRKEAMVAAKGQGIRAAQMGLAGKEAQVSLEDKGFNLTEMKNAQINQAMEQDYQAFSGMVDDVSAIGMMGAGGMKGGGGGFSAGWQPSQMQLPDSTYAMSTYRGSMNSNRRYY